MKTIFHSAFFLVLLFIITKQNFAQHGNCPRNAVDCKHGCGRFIDTDNDGYCDYSTLSDAVKQMLEKKKNTNTKDTLPTKTEKTNSPVNTDTSENKKKQSTQDTILSVNSVITTLNKTLTLPQPAKYAKVLPATKKPYDLITLSLLALGLYFFTYLLSRFKIIHRCNHRKIWNTLLLVTFIMACILGLVLVIQINYNVLGNWYKDFLFLHVEFGIAMTIIAIFHILWHWRYFNNLLKRSEKKSCNS